MGMLLAFAPFLAFAVIDRLAGPSEGLVAGAVVAAGLLAIVLASMALGRPFTPQYAREQVPPEHWDSPEFLRTNAIITAVRALAFAVMVAAERALLALPGMPRGAGIAAIVLALVGAIRFTRWYPDRMSARAGR